MRNIKSGAPARRFFLDRICLSRSHHHLGCRGLHLLTSLRPSQPFDRVDNSCLMMGEWQLHFAMCYPHPYTPKLFPSQIQLSPKIALLSAASLSVSYLILNVDDILTLRLSLTSLVGVTRGTNSYLNEV